MTHLLDLDLNKNYTYADYLTWHLEQTVELFKGKIMPMAAPAEYHQRISVRIMYQFLKYFEDKPCNIYTAPFDVRLYNNNLSANNSPNPNNDNNITTVVQPDLCVICDAAKIDKRGCIGSPDLIVEILSEGNCKKEMNNKFVLYEQAAVKEYWIVQPENKSIIVYILDQNNQYIGLKPFTEDQQIYSSVFKDLIFDLEPIFAPLK